MNVLLLPSSFSPSLLPPSLPFRHSFTMSSEDGSDEDNGCHDNGREEEFIFELSTEVGEKGGDERERKWEGLSPSPIGRGTPWIICTCSTNMQFEFIFQTTIMHMYMIYSLPLFPPSLSLSCSPSRSLSPLLLPLSPSLLLHIQSPSWRVKIQTTPSDSRGQPHPCMGVT